jgi:hypothetical protein
MFPAVFGALLQVPANPPSAEPLYLKVTVFEFGGFPAQSLRLSHASYAIAKQALEQQQMAVLTGKVRRITSWGNVGGWQAKG